MGKSETFDYIVVGAGSSGCVVAARLSEDPSCRVLVLEAGGPNDHPLMAMPLAFMHVAMNRRLNWNYQSEPEPNANNRRILLPRGKVLGGSGSINGMIYSRGHPRDYDEWRQLGNTGWSYADVLPYFKRAESDWRGETPYHGGSGPLPVVKIHIEDAKVLPSLRASAEKLGYRWLADFHGAEAEGFSVPDFTITKRGRRASTAVAYLKPAMSRPNLRVELNAPSLRVLIEKGRAVGVQYLQDGEVKEARAAREVIVSGGTYNSAQLLLLSGIGPADELRAAGVAPVHDLPGVGRNLQEHVLAALAFDADGPVAFDSELRFDKMAFAAMQWKLFGSGMAATLPVCCMGFYKTRPELERPDIKGNFYPTIMDSRIWFPLIRKARGHVLSNFNLLLRPQSRGAVTLKSTDPRDAPRIALNLFAEPADMATLKRTIPMMRELYNTKPLKDLWKREFMPGDNVRTDKEIEDYIRAACAVAQHPVGTCKMGIDDMAVVDPALKVRGLEGLRVADASVMPVVTGGNTNAPCIMIGEKASDLVLGRSLPRAEVPVAA
ncbi:MAG: GMC family oxidoreductase N-terminal domain-containing protein [Hyphomonadaceae bacterium]|nr:GMC family oxidoreductase N-terminal domain-containing protein [Hyphomonadaceae bacterium]